ncbi:MAG: hypothetical protein JRG92_22745 [Deltaproteobacteria bacterium]|nr:hypothetical protein [Deltaproteobacteria bacterium]MBW2386457.1 hypothetical protein [Deltaproteobacteria bacterium]MBW2698517.1 hypothetical protein [Deltaproteobacteria bacterium]
MSALERAERAWASNFAGLSPVEIDERVRGFATMVRAIAEYGVVSAERFAESMGLGVSRAEELFAELGRMGMQSDDAGNIVGAALTTRETPHRVRVAEKELYAWCALDTLFIPGLLGETADVESLCPISGEAIRLRVTPGSVESCDPSDAWLSVFLPGGSSRQTGPASPT